MSKKYLIVIIFLLTAIISFTIHLSTQKKTVSEIVRPMVTPNTITIVAAGDSTCNFTSKEAYECKDSEVVELAKKENPEFVLLLGDLQYGGGTLEQFNKYFSKTWGTFGEILRPSPGNHEYETPNAKGYFDYFNNIPAFYSFEKDNWHFISLDSNIISTEQLEWLENDLTENSKPCIIAFWHHPRFSSGYHGSNLKIAPFWDKLTEGKATIVLNGHDHHYERFVKQDGIREFIVGTGGRNLYPYVAIEQNSEFRTSDHFGYLKLSLLDGSYKWEFVSTDNEVVDSGEGNCSG